MKLSPKAAHELELIGLYSAFFGVWFVTWTVPKALVLAQYEIGLFILSAALIGALSVTGALLVFNALSVVRRHLDERGLARVLLSPLPPADEND